MKKDVSFFEFEDFLEDAGIFAVMQRIRRIIRTIAIQDFSGSELTEILLLSDNETSEFEVRLIEKYLNVRQRENETLEYWLAISATSCEQLSEVEPDIYDEEVIFISSCLSKLGLRKSVYYAAIMFDYSQTELLAEY